MSIVTNLTAQSAELFLSSFKSFPAQLQSINRKKYLLICTSLKHCICESSIPVSPPVFPPPTQVIFSNKGGESMILFPLQTLSPQKTTKPLWKTFPCSEPTPIPSAVLWISAECESFMADGLLPWDSIFGFHQTVFIEMSLRHAFPQVHGAHATPLCSQDVWHSERLR